MNAVLMLKIRESSMGISADLLFKLKFARERIVEGYLIQYIVRQKLFFIFCFLCFFFHSMYSKKVLV